MPIMVSVSDCSCKPSVKSFLRFRIAQCKPMVLTKKEKAGAALWGRIQEAMVEAKIKNQAALARELGISSQTISGWKKGKWQPKRENYNALSIISGMSIDYLESAQGRKFIHPKNDIEDRILSGLRKLQEEGQLRIAALTEFEVEQARGRGELLNDDDHRPSR